MVEISPKKRSGLLKNPPFTVFNFVMYNVVPGNLDKHGTHPHWLHALVNLQILYGPLGFIALYNSFNFIAEVVVNDWKNKPAVITGKFFQKSKYVYSDFDLI